MYIYSNKILDTRHGSVIKSIHQEYLGTSYDIIKITLNEF